MWLLTEVAICACDLAEVIGGAIALKLLFGLPIIQGIILTTFDVLLFLSGISPQNFRLLEAIVCGIHTFILQRGDGERSERKDVQLNSSSVCLCDLVLVGIVGVCFGYEVLLAKPSITEVFEGMFLPNLSVFKEQHALFVSLGIIGTIVIKKKLILPLSFVKQTS